jgi:hypothetical protein
MAQEVAHDVVIEAQSMGAPSSIGDSAIQPSVAPAVTGHPNATTYDITTTNDLSSAKHLIDKDDIDRIPTPDSVAPSREFAKSPLGEKALLAEASGGSDTDTSKPDDVGQKISASGHARSNSVKKPTSFKSVSVTKNFLAKAAVGVVTTTKPGEKGRSCLNFVA